ncbi:MAG: hypothetical protein UU34_C0021G0013 [Candidatus Curtissbacteria bacterium GW2011_GWA1_41_11]|uniref:Uncharacterized protein n=1 Tax=Candidatus Curtissbacteria bacterium GW2011_GWA1_41_11 TaxID=1618409 RepID=A0A0G0UAY0_9BACT|nr:MAG: hypothetical protein UU34_C0021G0013 [Candidatus Curtissbacteria bacterium GW2011_GWA1_41_11]
MDEGSSKSILTKIGLAVLVIALLDLFFLNYLTFKNQKESQESQVIEEDSRVIVEPSPPPIEVTEDQPEPSSAPPPAGGTTETKTIVEKETVVQTAQKEIFIPIGSGSVQKKDWTDVPGLEVTIDTTKYSVIESIVFEATVWPEGGNGRAYARLINISDSNPFVESQISSASNTGELKTSGSIPFPSGSKKYGVQAKSDIENFGAHVENARIKITLK